MAKNKKKNRKPNVPREQLAQQIANKPSPDVRLVAAQRIESFSGPIPPPALLEKYDAIIPGAANRILKMAEEQSKHRQHLEKKVISSDVANSKLGVVFGFIIGMAAIIGGVILSIYGKTGFGVFLSFSGLASLVGVFIYGTQQRKSERKEKREMLEERTK